MANGIRKRQPEIFATVTSMSITTTLLMTLDSAMFVHQYSVSCLSLLILEWRWIRSHLCKDCCFNIASLWGLGYQLTLLYAQSTGYIAPISITFSEFAYINIVPHLQTISFSEQQHMAHPLQVQKLSRSQVHYAGKKSPLLMVLPQSKHRWP